jgi:UDP-glucose 4-epimerase
LRSPSRKPKRAEAGGKRVLVTGAGGFLGSHIARYLGFRDFQVAAVGRFHAPLEIGEAYPNLAVLGGMTLPDPAFANLVARFQPDLLVHCAGTSSVAASVQEPYSDFQRTVDVCAFALESIRRHAPRCHFIHLSSASVYGQPKKLPIDESAPCAPMSPYGFHKRMCEILVEEYGALFGLSTAIVRIFSAYGENLPRQVVFDLCGKIAAARGGRVDVLGTGRESRDFIYAADVAQAVEILFAKGATGVFNLGSGRETTIASLLDILLEEMRSDAEPRFTRVSRPGDPLNWRADIGKLARLGFAPKVSLQDGLRRYCSWFREQASRAPAADWIGRPDAVRIPAKGG